MVEAYCVKCKAMREIKNTERVLLKNNRWAIRGVCAICGSKVFRLSKGMVPTAG